MLVGISGKMLSGKDTLADHLIEQMKTNLKGGTEVRRESFARPLKEEVQELIDLVNLSLIDPVGYIVSKVQERTNAPRKDCFTLVQLIIEEFNTRNTVLSTDRTTGMRTILQFWGTDVRRKADPDYWVNYFRDKDSEDIVMVFTDCRFENEAEFIEENGVLVRLGISPEEQERRMKNRDGFVNKDAFQHHTEIALDGYPFKHTFNTEQMTPEEIAERVMKIVQGR